MAGDGRCAGVPGHAALAPVPIRNREAWGENERETLLMDLETLTPAARLAFVPPHTVAVPFDQIAPIVGRSPARICQLGSRGC